MKNFKKSEIVFIISIILCFFSTLHGSGNSSHFKIISDGRALGVIYLAPDSSPVASYAAHELREHWAKATGVDIPIVDQLPEDRDTPVIYVGPSQRLYDLGLLDGSFDAEEHLIRSGACWLVLAGDDTEGSPFPSLSWSQAEPLRFGTLTAVYRLLEEQYGVRWFMPGDLGTVIPEQEAIVVPTGLELRGKPAFEDRLPRLSEPSNPEDYQPRDGDAGRWMLRVGFGRPAPMYFNHTFRYLNERHPSGYAKLNELFATRPEIYAVLPDGSRDFSTTSYRWGNLCLSEPATVEEFVKMMRWYFDTHPHYREFSIVPNDVWVPCIGECCLAQLDPDLQARIRAGAGLEESGGTTRLMLSPELMDEFRVASASILWDFIAKVAWQIYESHPDKLVGVLGGYGSYGDPKVAAEANLPPNIAVTITKARWDFWSRKNRDHYHDMVAAWSEITPHLYIWEYYIWNWRGWWTRPKINGYPVFFPEILQEDMDFMKDYMRGEKVQNEGWINTSPGLNHLVVYLTGKLLYDPELRVNDLLDDYYPAFYGDAQEPMRAFWEHAAACWMRDTGVDDYRNQSQEIMDILFTAEDKTLFFDLLETAKSKVAPASPEYQRIALIEQEMAMHLGNESGAIGSNQEFHSSAIFPAPAIDGAFHENWNRNSIKLHGPDKEEASPSTTIKVAHDPQNLYLTLFAEEIDSVALPSDTDLGWWYWKSGQEYLPRENSNSILIELLPTQGQQGRAVLLVNATGNMFDAWYHNPDLNDPAAWHSRARISTKIEDNGWSGTLSIPWESLGMRLSPGMGLKAKITRYRAGEGKQTWTTDAAAYGTLYFPED